MTDAASGLRRGGGGFNWSAPLTLYGTQVFSAPAAQWFSTPKLAAFLRDHAVLDVLLGVPPVGGAKPPPPVHVQTLTRLPLILKFLAQVRRLAVERGRPASPPPSPSTHLSIYAARRRASPARQPLRGGARG